MNIFSCVENSAQEVFEFVVEAIVKQGRPSVKVCEGNEGNAAQLTCLYRGDNGAKCGVGHLIPDDKYNGKAMEEKSARDLLYVLGFARFARSTDNANKENPRKTHPHERLLSALQNAHDTAAKDSEQDQERCFIFRFMMECSSVAIRSEKVEGLELPVRFRQVLEEESYLKNNKSFSYSEFKNLYALLEQFVGTLHELELPVGFSDSFQRKHIAVRVMLPELGRDAITIYIHAGGVNYKCEVTREYIRFMMEDLTGPSQWIFNKFKAYHGRKMKEYEDSEPL